MVYLTFTRGVVYGAHEAHNLIGWVQLPAPQPSFILFQLLLYFLNENTN